MSEITINRRSSKEKTRHPKIAVVALGATVLAAMGVHTVNRNSQPEAPATNAPHKEYVVKKNDNVSKLLTMAYPELDWRGIVNIVEDQIPEQDRDSHTLRPGQILIFNTDAKIGHFVDNSAESNSGGTG